MDNGKVVVQFVHALTSGGAETVVKDYAIALKQRAYDVQILVLHQDVDSPNQKQVEEMGVPIIPILKNEEDCCGLGQKAIRKIHRELKIRSFLKKYFSEIKPDIVHVHLSLVHYLLYAKYELKHTRIIYTCHSKPEALFSTNHREDKRSKKALKKFLNRGNTEIIALHSEMAVQIKNIFCTGHVAVLNNPIELKRFVNPGVDKICFRKSIGVPEKAFVVGHVGRFSAAKNHDFLVNVFAEIVRCRDDAFLMLVGDGPLKNQTVERLNDLGLKGKYLIFSNRRDIPQLDAIMDAFCLPSQYEGFSIVTLEAQAAGLRCFISEGVPQAAMCTDHIWRLRLEEGPEIWAEKMLQTDLPHQNIVNALDSFDREKVVGELEKIYFRCAK